MQLSELEGGKYKPPKRSVSANSINFTDVPSGKFKIVVSAPNVTSATTFVETPSSFNGWIGFLLFMVVGVGIAYYYWNKKRQEKIDVFTSNKAGDIFSSEKKGGASGTSSSSSDYF